MIMNGQYNVCTCQQRLKIILIKFMTVIMMSLSASFAFCSEANIASVNLGESTIEGTLSAVSALPHAESNPYPDCYYTALIEIKQILSGESIPKRVVLVLPGFLDRKYAPEAGFKIGDKVRATVVRFAAMPDRARQTQQADEIEEVDLELFFPRAIHQRNEFSTNTRPVPFAMKQAVDERVPLRQADLKARAVRKEQMQKDLNQINNLLKKHGDDWNKWHESLEPFRAEYRKQFEAKTQFWIGDSFFSAGFLDSGRIYKNEFIKSVIFLKRYLEARNVDLILVRVPQKGEVVDDLFTKGAPSGISNPYLLRFYKELLESDIEIVTDIIPSGKKLRLKYPLMYWYQDFSEAHPAEGMSWAIADELAKRVIRYKAIESAQKKSFSIKEASQPLRNFKWPTGNPKFNSEDYVKFSTITDANGKPLEIKQGSDSPILMIGSSFIAYPSLDKGGSIPHYFAYQTGVIPDILYRSGGDKNMLRNVAREGEKLLAARSVCLFPFVPGTALSELTPLPIIDPYNSKKELIAEYKGTGLRQNITASSSNSSEDNFSYSTEGFLSINPLNGKGAQGEIKVKVPAHIKDYPYFTVVIDFGSKDTTYIVAKYGNGIESNIRSNDQLASEEVFAFHRQESDVISINFTGNSNYIRTIIIKSITFYGIADPILHSSKSSKL